MKIISKKEKERILNKLKEDYGIGQINGTLLETGKGKIRLFTGNLAQEEVNRIIFNIRTEMIGIYLAKKDENETRISFDSLSLFRNEVSKSVIEISDEDAKIWGNGEEIGTDAQNKNNGFVIIRNNGNLLGCGKIKDGQIKNFVPKERRTNC
ncbi:MAG: tRNA pseudouridine(55) synthase TruB [Nanoarchaeota archaeon]